MDELPIQYESRRSQLLEIATLLQGDLQELLEDSHFQAQVTGNVLRTDQFIEIVARQNLSNPMRDVTSQVTIVIDDVSFEEITAIRDVIANNYSVISERWKDTGGTHPCMALVCQLPTLARPIGYSQRMDLPAFCIVMIEPKPERSLDRNIISLDYGNFDAIALSGGGLRATLFHIGILLRLFLGKELDGVQLIVSVSGGSITLAHFAKNWSRATQSREGFVSVAAELIKFTQTDIRNSVFIPWIWTRPLVFSWFTWSMGRSARLERVYKKHFGTTRLEDLTDCPLVGIVATDSIKSKRVVFTQSSVSQFDMDGTPRGAILSRGVKISLAVATSSCFPPVFRRFRLSYRELGLKYSEFQEEMYLNDGGVVGNLGIEALHHMCAMTGSPVESLLVCDAETGQVFKPGTSPITDSNAQSAALSESSRSLAGQSFKKAVFVRFAERVSERRGLPFDVETAIGGYRTDLDKPSMPEVAALVLHGEAACNQALGTTYRQVDKSEVLATVADILTACGAERFSSPTEAELRGCSSRHFLGVYIHAVACAIITFAALWLLTAAASRLYTYLVG